MSKSPPEDVSAESGFVDNGAYEPCHRATELEEISEPSLTKRYVCLENLSVRGGSRMVFAWFFFFIFYFLYS